MSEKEPKTDERDDQINGEEQGIWTVEKVRGAKTALYGEKEKGERVNERQGENRERKRGRSNKRKGEKRMTWWRME